jgi:hypothetical protein
LFRGGPGWICYRSRQSDSLGSAGITAAGRGHYHLDLRVRFSHAEQEQVPGQYVLTGQHVAREPPAAFVDRATPRHALADGATR